MKISSFNDLKIRTKLVLLSNLVFIALMVCTGVVIIIEEKKQIVNELRTNLQESNKSMTDLINFSRDMISTVQQKDLQAFIERSEGEFAIDDETQELIFNDQKVRNNDKILRQIRNRVYKTHNFIALYEYNAGSFRCVNSTNKNRLGFIINDQDSVYQKIKSGKKATLIQVQDDKYISSCLLQIKNNGEVIGLMEMGRAAIAEWKINKIISEKKVLETGFSCFAKDNGQVLYTGKKFEKGNIKDEEFFKRSVREGLLKNNFDVQYKDTAVTVFYNKVPQLNGYLYTIVKVEEYLKPVKKIRNYIILAIIIGSFVFVVFSYLLARNIISGIDLVIDIIKELGKGRIDVKTNLERSDEIGLMSESVGNMVQGLNKKIDFAKEIGEGNFESDFKLLSDDDLLGQSLIEMRENLISAKNKEEDRRKEDDKRNWVTQELAELGKLLRINSHNIEELSYSIISKLVSSLKANQGALFILDESDDDTAVYYEMKAAIAYDRRRLLNKKVELGYELVGRCAFEKKTIYMTDIPQGYTNITSGMGEATPNTLLLVPLIAEDRVMAVIEIASFNRIDEYEIDFVEKLGESIASTISSVKISEKTSNLLLASNSQREEMAAQEEELRQNLEEMQTTQEDLKRHMEQNETFKLELSKQTTLLDALMDTLPDFIFFKDLQSRFIRVSSSMLSIFNAKTVDEIEGKSDFDYNPKDIAQSYYDEEQNIIETKEGYTNRLQKEIKVDGSELLYSVSKLPLMDKDGNVIGTFGISKEIRDEEAKFISEISN